MKTKHAFIIGSFMLFLGTSSYGAENTNTPEIPGKENTEKTLSPEERARLAEIENRIEEIKNMDMKSLTKEERKALKSELKEMKSEAKQMAGGIYISVGALILILILIIIFA